MTVDLWGTIIVGVTSLIVGYIAGVYIPIKFRKEDRKPKINIGNYDEWSNSFEISNHGGPLLDLRVEIERLAAGVPIKEILVNYFS